ncbi:glycosyltransferase family 2 protein [Candidatus Pelagibacter communis]|uniref:glycosyltransferase family 2 protein n=1 Tax=Candidatus Pelagibacter TaxID=198251 RepID=UPI003EE2DDA6
MEDITLVIPAKNEKESLPSVLDELSKYNLKKIVVLEKSDVQTIDAIKHYDLRILFQIKKGYGAALIEGIESVKTKYFVIFNADGSFNPNELKLMFEKVTNNNADLVFGTRYEVGCGSDDDNFITLVGNFIFTKIGKIFFKLNLTDILYTFVLGKTKLVNNLKIKNYDFSYCIALPIIAKKNNLKLCNSKSFERKRIGGKKKVNAFKDGMLILLSMIKLFFKN